MRTPNGMSPAPGESPADFDARTNANTDQYMAAIDRREAAQEAEDQASRAGAAWWNLLG